MKIIFEDMADGSLRIMNPSQRTLDKLSGDLEDRVLQIALKDLPEGTKFKIVNDEEVPSDKSKRNGWLYSDSENEALIIDQNYVPVHSVSKQQIIKRLENAGKFEKALALLESDKKLLHKWLAALSINSDDQPAIKLFTDIGLDPDEILKKE